MRGPSEIQQKILDYVAANPDASKSAVAAVFGVSNQHVGKTIARYGAGAWVRAAVEERAAAAEGGAEEVEAGKGVDEAADTDVDDGVVVAREYLTTLEALRDVVVENSRLRRLLHGAAA